jgi:glycerophosphoryl diester phosphodiesterase
VLVETDVQVHDGVFVAEHEHRAGPLSYDWHRRLLRLSHPPFELEPVLQQARRLDARLLLDLKLDATWVPALLGLVKRHVSLDTVAFTGEWRPLDAIRESGVKTAGFNYGGMNRWWKLERFLRQQPRLQRPGVSLHKKLASRENIDRLHAGGAAVLVYVVWDPAEALDLLQRGADGLITNNIALAEVWSQPDAST